MSEFIQGLDKKSLRKFFISRRNDYFDEYSIKNNSHIHLRPITESSSPCVVGSYLPFKNEVPTNFIHKELRKLDCEICLPCINSEDSSMIFRKFESNNKLVANKYGILEPSKDSYKSKPSILIVPLVAFSHEGYRLGYGGGYYDRFIKANMDSKDFVTIGLGFSFQKYDLLPFEEHDQKLNWILTEKYLYKVK